MARILIVLGGLVVLFTVLTFLSPITRRARRRLAEYEANAPSGAQTDESPRDTAAETRAVVSSTPMPSAAAAIPEDQTAGFHFKQLMTHGGIIGAFCLVLLVLCFPFQVRIMAENFEVVLNRAGEVQGTLVAGGWRIDVTDLQLYGLAISVSVIVLSAAFAASRVERSFAQWVVFVAGVIPIVVFEVAVAALRGYLLADGSVTPAVMAVWSGLQGWILAMVEILGGQYGIHRFLVPLIQTLVWLVVAPFRGFGRVLRRGVPLVVAALKPRERERGRPGLATRAAAYLDEALLRSLRGLDDAVHQLLSKIRVRKERV